MTTKAHKRKNRSRKRKELDGGEPMQAKKRPKESPSSSSITSTRGSTEKMNETPLLFQDVMARYSVEDSSLAFFELANASSIAYRLNPTDEAKTKKKTKNKRNNPIISIRQNSQAQTHTGGVVWETSYLLLEYLQFIVGQKSPIANSVGRRVVEVGAGCGLLGLSLAFLPNVKEVLLTETEEVLSTILLPNVEVNQPATTFPCRVSACALDWLHYESDFEAYASSSASKESTDSSGKLMDSKFDTIVGTDVVFSPSLVEPLLATLRFLSHSSTITYLCLQSDRCPKSYDILQNKASGYGFTIEEVDLQKLRQQGKDGADSTVPSFVNWGEALECHLLCLRQSQSK